MKFENFLNEKDANINWTAKQLQEKLTKVILGFVKSNKNLLLTKDDWYDVLDQASELVRKNTIIKGK